MSDLVKVNALSFAVLVYRGQRGTHVPLRPIPPSSRLIQRALWEGIFVLLRRYNAVEEPGPFPGSQVAHSGTFLALK